MQAHQLRAVPVVSSRDGAGKLVQVRMPLTESNLSFFERMSRFYNEQVAPKCTAAGYRPPILHNLADERRKKFAVDSYILGETGDISVLIHAVQIGGADEVQLLRSKLLNASDNEVCTSTIIDAPALGPQRNEHIEAIDKFLTGLVRLAENIPSHELPVITGQVLNRVYVEKYLAAGASSEVSGRQVSIAGQNAFPLHKVQIPKGNGSVHKLGTVVFRLDTMALQQTALDGTQRTTTFSSIDIAAALRAGGKSNGNGHTGNPQEDISITVMVTYGADLMSVRTAYEKQTRRENAVDLDYADALVSFTSAGNETSRDTFVARAELKPETWMSIGLPKPGTNPDLPIFLFGDNTDGALFSVLGAFRSRISRVEFLTAVYGDVALLAHVGSSDIFRAVSS